MMLVFGFAASANAEAMTCLAPPATQGQLSVSGDANGQHFVFQITVDGVALPDASDPASKDQKKPKFEKATCDYIS